MKYHDDWIETVSGVKFHFMDPKPEEIILEDIATSLSRICRYNGHTRRFYSVAEHCCLMSDWVLRQPWGDVRMALTALHHDDAEAYIGDLSRPIKEEIPDFIKVEKRIEFVISAKFGFEYPFENWLKQADTAILIDERQQVINKSSNEWAIDKLHPLGVKTWSILGRYSCWTRYQWLRRHHTLMKSII